MLNLLVETRNEYTTHLINIITPLIYEGLSHIYNEAREISEDDTKILKTFQAFLERITQWSQVMIDNETNRIVNSSKTFGWLNDLIRATIKSNLVILMYNPTVKNQVKIDKTFYQNIKTSDFIHHIYIECSRELWNNPYLMFHKYPPIELLRNQRDTLGLIKECIKEAIRKLLPVKHILQAYLGEDTTENIKNINFNKVITDTQERNLTNMINKDLLLEDKTHKLEDKKSEKHSDIKKSEKHTDNTQVTIRGDLLNMLEDDLSDTSSYHKTTVESNISNLSKFIPNKPSSESNKQESHDEKIKKILKNFNSDSDTETSLINYEKEENENRYHEIFSNSIVTPNKQNNKEKDKYFNRYFSSY